MEEVILDKMEKVSGPSILGVAASGGPHNVYAHRIASYFVKALTFVPHFSNERDGQKRSEDYKVFSFTQRSHASIACCAINSTLFYMYYIVFSDAYHCGRELIERFPLDIARVANGLADGFKEAEGALMRDLKHNSDIRTIAYKNTGMVEMQKFFPKLSKPLLDNIDRLLAKHYGLTESELDFVLNYDIKFRLGSDSEGEDEE
jgi:hypothetical protein